MTQNELVKIIKNHRKWMTGEANGEKADLSNANLSGANLSSANLSSANLSNANLSDADLSGADLRNANLSNANLRGADLSYANLSDADLSGADLRSANLRNANLSYANLSDADLSGADLRGADLSGAKGLLSPIDFMQKNFEHTEDGYIVYKAFNGVYKSPASWTITKNSVINENINADRANNCGCGINVAPLAWVKKKYPNAEIYKLLIKWEWLSGVVVPYNTDGKIRCERAMILGEVDNYA